MNELVEDYNQKRFELDLEFVRAYIAKHVELLGNKNENSKTSIQLKFAHLGMVDEPVMGPDRWFTDDEMGKGTPRRLGMGARSGLNKDPVTIFVYGFVRDNLELFRKHNELRTTENTA